MLFSPPADREFEGSWWWGANTLRGGHATPFSLFLEMLQLVADPSDANINLIHFQALGFPRLSPKESQTQR